MVEVVRPPLFIEKPRGPPNPRSPTLLCEAMRPTRERSVKRMPMNLAE